MILDGLDKFLLCVAGQEFRIVAIRSVDSQFVEFLTDERFMKSGGFCCTSIL